MESFNDMQQRTLFKRLNSHPYMQVWFQNRRAKWRRQEKSESLRLGLTHFTQLPHRLGCGSGLPVDPWLSPPLLSALPGFLSHPQTVYPSYLTPPLSLAPSSLTMSSLAAMGHHIHGPHGPPMHIGPPPPLPLPPPQTSGPPTGGHHMTTNTMPASQLSSHHGGGHLSHLSTHLSRLSPQNLATISPQLNGSGGGAQSIVSSMSAIANSNSSTAHLTPPPVTSHLNSPHAANCASPSSAAALRTDALSPQNLTTNSCNSLTAANTPSPPATTNAAKCASSTSATNIDVDVGCESPVHQGSGSGGNQMGTASPSVGSGVQQQQQQQTGDIRSNSIATLRIKAKEHLESLSKGLAAMV